MKALQMKIKSETKLQIHLSMSHSPSITASEPGQQLIAWCDPPPNRKVLLNIECVLFYTGFRMRFQREIR